MELAPKAPGWHYQQGMKLLDEVITRKLDPDFHLDSANTLVASAQAYFTAGILAHLIDG